MDKMWIRLQGQSDLEWEFQALVDEAARLAKKCGLSGQAFWDDVARMSLREMERRLSERAMAVDDQEYHDILAGQEIYEDLAK